MARNPFIFQYIPKNSSFLGQKKIKKRFSGPFGSEFALAVDELDFQRHLAYHVGGAAEAGVKRADDGFDAVEHAFFELFGFDEFLRDLRNGHVVGEVVVFCGDYHVDFGDHAFRVDFVVVN